MYKNPPNFSQADRHHRIREQALRYGYVSINELASAFDVSIMTIHRDIDMLSQVGWLVKVRGGARVHPSVLRDTSVIARSEQNSAEKRAIATQALTHIQPGQVIFLDESTTSLAIANGLDVCAPLTVISNSMLIIARLSKQPMIELISIGGTYSRSYDAVFGMIAVEAVGQLKVDTLFLSVTAIDDGMCCCRSADSAQLKKELMRSSTNKFLLVDHSKLGSRALYALAPVTDFDLLIVDDGITASEHDVLRASGATVQLAPLHIAGKASHNLSEASRDNPT